MVFLAFFRVFSEFFTCVSAGVNAEVTFSTFFRVFSEMHEFRYKNLIDFTVFSIFLRFFGKFWYRTKYDLAFFDFFNVFLENTSKRRPNEKVEKTSKKKNSRFHWTLLIFRKVILRVKDAETKKKKKLKQHVLQQKIEKCKKWHETSQKREKQKQKKTPKNVKKVLFSRTRSGKPGKIGTFYWTERESTNTSNLPPEKKLFFYDVFYVFLPFLQQNVLFF